MWSVVGLVCLFGGCLVVNVSGMLGSSLGLVVTVSLKVDGWWGLRVRNGMLGLQLRHLLLFQCQLRKLSSGCLKECIALCTISLQRSFA